MAITSEITYLKNLENIINNIVEYNLEIQNIHM